MCVWMEWLVRCGGWEARGGVCGGQSKDACEPADFLLHGAGRIPSPNVQWKDQIAWSLCEEATTCGHPWISQRRSQLVHVDATHALRAAAGPTTPAVSLATAGQHHAREARRTLGNLNALWHWSWHAQGEDLPPAEQHGVLGWLAHTLCPVSEALDVRQVARLR